MSKFRATINVEISKKYRLKFKADRVSDLPESSWTRYEVVEVETGQRYVFNRPTDDPEFSSKRVGDRFTIEAEPAGDQRITVYVPKLRRVELK